MQQKRVAEFRNAQRRINFQDKKKLERETGTRRGRGGGGEFFLYTGYTAGASFMF